MGTSEIRRLQSVLTVIEDGTSARLIKKTATATGEQELLDQIEFFTNVPRAIAIHYPTVIKASTTVRPYSYTMPFYEYPTLTSLFLYSQLTASQLTSILMAVLDFLLTQQHPIKRKSPHHEYIEDVYIARMRRRLARMTQIDALFGELERTKYIAINNKVICSPIANLDRIARHHALLARLMPEQLLLTHGQLRFDHILVDYRNNRCNDFILLEPRGLYQLRDIAYEFGKVWQCLRSRILWVEQKEYILGRHYILEDTLCVENYGLNLEDRQRVADDVIAELGVYLERAHQFNYNKEWLTMASLFAEATHSCAGVPFFYEATDVTIGLAYYLAGATALQSFVDRYCK